MKRFLSLRPFSYLLNRPKSDTNLDLAARLRDLEKRVEDAEEGASLERLIDFYASRPLHKLNDLNEVVYYCSRPDYNANIFCHMELPVLLSRLIKSIDVLPCGLSAMPSIQAVRSTYSGSFQKLIRCSLPETNEKIDQFRKVVSDIEKEHAKKDILLTLAKGLAELKDLLSSHRIFINTRKKPNASVNPLRDVQEGLKDLTPPLDDFSLRMVYYNFLSRMLLYMDETKGGEKIGMVDLNIDLEDVVRNAVEDAKQITTEHYGDCPDVRFTVFKDQNPMKFAHMGSTISYIVVELMKNAFRATVESHMERNSSGIVTCVDMPPVDVFVTFKENARHACICISDEGLGMTQSEVGLAMTYAFTSVESSILENVGDHGESREFAPLAGYGFGLPMSRVYARSFGGDLVISSMEGYGTRVYYYIKL